MTKYNQNFKHQTVEFYFQHHENLSLTCRTFAVPKRTLRRWLAQYQHSGINGLAVLHTKRTYTPDFKYQIIQTIQNRELTLDQACLQFGIANSGVISQWLKLFQESGIEGLQPKSKGRPAMKKPRYAKMPPPPKTEEERLRLRILELETENAYLKKCQELDREKIRKKPTLSKN